MSQQRTVLVLEDDQSLLNGIRDILEIQGYKVLTAVNGKEGLKIMEHSSRAPDLIVSDIMMPQMDGYAFLEHIRQEIRWMQIPFIFLTAKGEKHDIRYGKMLGVEDYLVKPFDAEELVVVVAAKIRRSDDLDRLRRANVDKIKTNILTIIHHEMRTPLTYVVAYADMANRDIGELSTEELRDFLKGISSGADRLRHLVENFILLVELETGEAVSTYRMRSRVMKDLQPLLAQAEAQATSFAEEKKVTLDFSPLSDAIPAIVGDPEYLRAAIVRLLDNGIKFSDKPDSVVQLWVSHDDEYVRIHVKDTGRGVPEAEISEIFETFYQSKREIYEDQGAGAGLPIIRRIVELHGGKVELETESGKGSCFTLCLPIHKE